MNIYPAAANSDVMGTSNANCRIRLGTTGGGHARAYETANVNVSTSPHKTVVRKGAGQVTTYDNGAVTTVGTGLTDTTPGAETITFLKGPTYSATRMAAGYFTPAILTDTDVANMHSRLNAYLSEIGAA
ncbi:hypothetical protein [uncultured Roseibium sp.]|uniref:hypothetical protein n=1 Tax=uncultured Roseibium sp. TaxID=1936171 RepID=UPI0032173BF6